MVSHWGLSDSKSPQVSRTLLSILVDLNKDVVWIVSIHPLISKSTSPFINRLVTVPKAPVTIGITAIFMSHSFFDPQARSRYLSFFFFAFFQFYSVVCRDSKVHNSASSLSLSFFFFFFDYHQVWSSGLDYYYYYYYYKGFAQINLGFIS